MGAIFSGQDQRIDPFELTITQLDDVLLYGRLFCEHGAAQAVASEMGRKINDDTC